jgi:hypothetical protein
MLRLAHGFVVECELDGPDRRLATFPNGSVAREVLVGVDNGARGSHTRTSRAAGNHPPATRRRRSSRKCADRSRFVWITDVVPDSAAPVIDQLMDRGIRAIKQTPRSEGPAW